MMETRDKIKKLCKKIESHESSIIRLIDTAKCQSLYRELDEIRRKGDYLKVDDLDAI
jgi:hypothetical protein